MLNRILQISGIQKQEDRDSKLYDALIRHEAKIGGTIFGAVPKGGRREFFCLDPYTWVWYEEWKDKEGKRRSRTTRYNVRPDSIIKIQNGKQSQQISRDEAGRFFDAVQAYQRKVNRELYNIA